MRQLTGTQIVDALRHTAMFLHLSIENPSAFAPASSLSLASNSIPIFTYSYFHYTGWSEVVNSARMTHKSKSWWHLR